MMLRVNLMKTPRLLSPMLNFLRSRTALMAFAVLFASLLLSADAFAQSGGIKGKVRNVRGGGIPNAAVTVRQGGKDVKTARADSKGNFTLSGLAAGDYNVVFEADGYATGLLSNVEVKNKVRDLGSRLILSVDQGSQVIIRGSVFYREGASLAGAKVELHRINADGSTNKISTAYTTGFGEFTFRPPKSDTTYRVIAESKGVTGSKDISVDNPAIYRTAITLDLPMPK
jgi:hypothetical protein